MKCYNWKENKIKVLIKKKGQFLLVVILYFVQAIFHLPVM